MKELLPLHWEELALNRDAIKLDMFEARYAEMEAAGALMIVTARSAGRLVGYFITFLLPHLHYRSAGLMAHTDMYFVLKEFRNGAGTKLILCVQEALKRRGVRKMYMSCKAHLDQTRLFEALGFTLSDKMFTKMLG
jgi:L-amino acid N-acyltransferase YncA